MRAVPWSVVRWPIIRNMSGLSVEFTVILADVEIELDELWEYTLGSYTININLSSHVCGENYEQIFLASFAIYQEILNFRQIVKIVDRLFANNRRNSKSQC